MKRRKRGDLKELRRAKQEEANAPAVDLKKAKKN